MASSNFSFALHELSDRLGERTKLVIINSPNNPTGGVVPAGTLHAAAELILGRPAWVLCDEEHLRISDENSMAQARPRASSNARKSSGQSTRNWIRCIYARVGQRLADSRF
jgi:aspartate/methionine/tyrosine aminotransferase